MLSILVCHSYYLRFDQKQLERGKPYPALATLQVASMLRKAGHVCRSSMQCSPTASRSSRAVCGPRAAAGRAVL